MRFLLLERGVICIEHFCPLSCRLDTYYAGCLNQLGLTHALARYLADSPLMSLTVLQAILEHFLESACRASLSILINDVRSLPDGSFPEDPIIIPLCIFLDLQPIQSL